MKFEHVYEVKELIGKGTFAEVKKCLKRETRELFAVKEIRLGDEEDTRMAQNEVDVSPTLFACKPPHLLPMRGFYKSYHY